MTTCSYTVVSIVQPVSRFVFHLRPAAVASLLAMFVLMPWSGSATAAILDNSGEPNPSHDGGTMKLWLRADQGVTTGGTFTWADQSTHGNDATQGVAANQPTHITVGAGTINGQPVVDFDGANDSLLGSLGAPALVSDSFTAFAVIESDGPGTSYHPFDGNNLAQRFGFASYIAGGDNVYFLRFGGANGLSSVAESLAPQLFSTVGTNIATSTITQSLNGSEIQSTVFGTLSTITGYRVGSRFDGVASFVDGRIAEILIYDQALTASEVNAVGFYLQDKYGINGSFFFVPEPSTGLLLGLGIVGLMRSRRRRCSKENIARKS